MSGSIAERVAAGIAWLDEHRPSWWQRIDLDTLDMNDPCRCILGQEYLDFYDSPFHSDEAAVWFGFDCDDELDSAAELAEFVALTEEWRRVIAERRTAAKVPT